MKVSLLLCVIATAAFLKLGDCLQCYSCVAASTNKCEIKAECTGTADACLKLKYDGVTYNSCVAYSDCSFDALSQIFPLPRFSFKCCQSDLCNGPSLMETVREFFG